MFIEKEYKILLNEKEYDYIKKKIQFDTTKTQTNYYFDTLEYQNFKDNRTIRIRETKNSELRLQVKIPISNCNFTTKKEFSCEVNRMIDQVSISMLNEMGVDTNIFQKSTIFTKIGELKTERKISILEDCKICLDKSTYQDVVDYELEIEFVSDLGKKKAEEIIKDLGISITSKPLGKYRRFVKRLIEREVYED